MPKWRVQIYWWGIVNGYPSSLWKTIEEHDDEIAATTSRDEWIRLFGRQASYRVIGPEDLINATLQEVQP